MLIDSRNRFEIDVVDRKLLPTVHKVKAASAWTVNGRNVQFHRLRLAAYIPCTQFHATRVCLQCVAHTEGHGRDNGLTIGGGAHARIIALEPSTSPFLTTGKGGAHRVEGTAVGFWPPHLVKGTYDEARAIDENEGRAMAKRAAREEGIFAGTSTGLNLVAALALARELGPGKVVATVACDTGLKYLAGDLFK